MARSVSNLSWLPVTGEIASGWCALIQCAATDGDTLITVNGNTQDGSYNVKPRYMLVDNIANNGICTVTLNAAAGAGFQVSQYDRRVFPISANQVVKINVATGTVNVWFSENPLAPEAANQLAIQSTAVRTLIYGYVNYNVDQTQLVTDQNSNTLFNPTIGTMTYSLLSVAGNIGNGWFQFVKNRGTKSVLIKPAGGDQINSLYNAVTNLKLEPGDSGYLSSDGVNWYFDGKISFTSALQPIVSAGNLTLAHGMAKRPNFASVFVQNLTAENGYAVGDILQLNPNVNLSSTTDQGNPFITDTANVVLRYGAAGAISNLTLHKTTGVRVNINNVNWNLFVRAELFW